MNTTSNQKGSSLLFTILITSFIMSISFGVSYILFQEIKMTRDMGNSVVAFYAAETGIEKAMMSQYEPSDFAECLTLSNESVCYDVKNQTSNCSSENYCLTSTGSYKNTKRALEIQY